MINKVVEYIKNKFYLFTRKFEFIIDFVVDYKKFFLSVLGVICTIFLTIALWPESPRWNILLVSGSYEQNVFDNAMAMIAPAARDKLTPLYRYQRLTSDRNRTNQLVKLANFKNLEEAFGKFKKPAYYAKCFIYLTSHGDEGKGLHFQLEDKFLTPTQLDAHLDKACGQLPTIVVISGCYSGSFVDPVMHDTNRVILTASDANRPSFGCSNDLMYNFYDRCFIENFPQSEKWRDLYDSINQCITKREKEEGYEPSYPQFFIGKDVEEYIN